MKDLKKITILSIIISSVIVFTYFGIETFCVKTGRNMPVQTTESGGECVVSQGIFWSVTILAPLTSVDDPVAAGPPIEGFSIPSLILAVIILSFILWVILCLFSRNLKPVLIVAGSIAAIFLLVTCGKKLKKAWDEIPTELSSITVITSDIHPNSYFSLRYPYDASYLIPPQEDGTCGKTGYDHMDQNIRPEDVTKKQLRALIKAAKNVKSNTDTDRQKDFMYQIELVYKQHKGYGHIRTEGYGEIPPDWAEFVRLTNEICGVDYLREKPEPVTFSYEWFAETYGIHDEDMPEGASVEQFITYWKITMRTICGINSSGDYTHFDPSGRLEKYLAAE